MSDLGRAAGLSGFLEIARQVGVDAYALADSVGLPAAALTDPNLRVSVQAMARMYELAAERSGADDFALRVAETRRLSNLGLIGLVMREQPTVRQALQALARYQWLHNSAYDLQLHEFGDSALLQINGIARRSRQTGDITVATAVRNLRALLGEAWRPQAVWLTHAAPARMDTYRRVLGVAPLFDQDAVGLILSREDLDAAIPSADPAIAREVVDHLERLTEARPTQTAQAVRELVERLLPDGDCSVERVAQHMGMDRRTLHRRLSAEGVTFSTLLDDTRRELATSLLATSERPLQQVAEVLGFSSLSAFAHWFRRKFGQSATAYRNGEAGEAPAGRRTRGSAYGAGAAAGDDSGLRPGR